MELRRGAAYYEIQVDGDPNFAQPDISKSTAQNITRRKQLCHLGNITGAQHPLRYAQ